MSYVNGLEKSSDNFSEYLNKMFERGKYSRAEEPRKAIQINEKPRAF